MTSWTINGRLLKGMVTTQDSTQCPPSGCLLWAITSPTTTTFTFGGQNMIPLVGDWNGTGIEGIGAYDPSNAVFNLKVALSSGTPDYSFPYGAVSDTPISWFDNGINNITADRIGIIRGNCAFLTTALVPGPGNVGVVTSQISCPSSGVVAQCTIPSTTTNIGILAVQSTPSGAEIYIDGIDTVNTTPSTICGLSAGLHNYKLTLSGYNDYTNSINITYGVGPIVNPTLTPVTVQAGFGTVEMLLIGGLAIGVLYIAMRRKTPPSTKGS